MDTSDIEARLRGARERFAKAEAAWGGKQATREAYDEALAELLSSERELASARGEEYAVPLAFPVPWDTGAPMPHLITAGHLTFLTFFASVSDANWDGTYATVQDMEVRQPIAIVRFIDCRSAMLGQPNDEVLHGHRLYGRGLEPYEAQIVQNSRWLAELEEINKVHASYHADSWRRLKHYVFWFHDNTFECIAESYEVEVCHESMAAVLARVCEHLLSG